MTIPIVFQLKMEKALSKKKAEDMILNGLDIQVIPETTLYQILKNE
ncbi:MULTISPECIES: hypothetical protein [Clostridium]|uniref:Uncharacterized protein n=1 Tax=Clostridium frigoriphilum TaxID=443253 RepID=A0ABU7USI9_9CLOT|nr:hypothetical protein [Clostridium sp. DSM 17811]MBU3100604.1 hypothetical protein [Clostridium sp. DSM 17811]